MQYSVSLVQRLVLRLEDSATLARIESSFVLNLKLQVPASIAGMLFTAAGSWKKVKEEEPARLDRPMRCALLVCMFAELKERMEAVVTQTDKIKQMEDMGWVASGSPVTWRFMKWDPTLQRQTADTSKPPLTQAEVLEVVGRILQLIPRQHVIGLFHPTRKLTQEMQGSNLVLLLQTGQHGESCATMREACRSCATAR